jgi:glycosyltransferase involved in cell wall biosynthesis
MSNNIAVSIIVPVYNTAPFLKRCLDSLCVQSLTNIEILCIDDASTDNSLEILNEFSKKDTRIKVFTNAKNSGAAVSRNVGIANASGEFIGFCDSDDYVDRNYYKLLYINGKDVDIVRGIRVIGEHNKHAKNPFGCIVPSIIRRSFLTTHRLRFPIQTCKGEDSRFKRWCYSNNPTVHECQDNGVYYHYMKRAGSLSNYKL